MATAKFILEKENSFGEQQVYVHFTHAQTRAKAPTGIYVRKKDLDIKSDKRFFKIKSQVTVTDEAKRKINIELEAIRIKVQGLLLEYARKGEEYTAADLKTAFAGASKKGGNAIVFLDDDFFKEYKSYLVKKKGNAEKWFRGDKSRIKLFATYLGNENEIPLKGINQAKLDDFVDWALDEKNAEPGYLIKTNTSIRKLFEYLELRGYPIKKGLQHWKPSRKIKLTDKPAKFITDEEYAKLYKHVPSKPHLQIAKDCFIILYNTGSRYSETKIDEADIIGNRLVNYNSKKDKTVKKPITEDLREVLERYGNNPPRVNDVVLNRNLKELFKEAGLDRLIKVVTTPGGKRKEELKPLHEVISTKFGRTSLVSNLIKNGAHEKWIRENFTGHARPINMSPYLGFDDEYTEKALELFKRKKED